MMTASNDAIMVNATTDAGENPSGDNVSTGTWAEAPAITPSSKKLYAAMEDIANHHGGPYQFLAAELKLPSGSADTQDAADVKESLVLRNAFTEYLTTTLPEMDSLLYHHDMKLPSIKNDDEMAVTNPLLLHVSSLGCSLDCSSKDPPGKPLFMELISLMLMHGFKTANEPLLVTQPDSLAHVGLQQPCFVTEAGVSHPLAVASLGYVKGFARSLTALALLCWCQKTGFDLEFEHPLLHKSLLTIYVHQLEMDNAVEETLKNLQISCSGSIRRPPNVVQMVSMIVKLINKGQLKEWTDFIKRWNMRSVRTHQVSGQRAASMKLLFELAPRIVLGWIVLHVQKMTFPKCAWTDDNLAAKKAYVGHKFPSKNKHWVLRVSDESMMLMVARIQYEFENTIIPLRKYSSAEVVTHAELAAAVLFMGAEVKAKLPISDDTLKSLGWLNIFVVCMVRPACWSHQIMTYLS